MRERTPHGDEAPSFVLPISLVKSKADGLGDADGDPGVLLPPPFSSSPPPSLDLPRFRDSELLFFISGDFVPPPLLPPLLPVLEDVPLPSNFLASCAAFSFARSAGDNSSPASSLFQPTFSRQ